MGKRAMTPARLAERIVRFNKERHRLQVYLKLDEKFTHICDKSNDVILLSAKHEYIEELMEILYMLYCAGYYCTFSSAHVIQSSYYKTKHKGFTSHNSLKIWRENFNELNLL